MPKKKSPLVSRPMLQVVYDLACEMSFCSTYHVQDDDGEDLGRDPKILDALNNMRETFHLKGSVEK